MKEVKVSALIFSMNKIDMVESLVSKIKNYVDEVVIIDSSSKRNHEILKERVKSARIYWFSPVGMADLLYQIGINLCRFDWILQLDDDEEPNANLLKELKYLPFKFNAKVFIIKRLERTGCYNPRIRFFNRRYVRASGIIHWGFVAETKEVVELDDRYLIIHHDEDELLRRIKRLWKYSIIESYQWGYKVVYALKNQRGISAKAGKLIFSILSKINKSLAYYLSGTFANVYQLFVLPPTKCNTLSAHLRRFLINLLYRPVYVIFIQINITRGFFKKLKIWEDMLKAGDAIKYMELENPEKVAQLANDNGITNFITLVENRLDNGGGTDEREEKFREDRNRAREIL